MEITNSTLLTINVSAFLAIIIAAWRFGVAHSKVKNDIKQNKKNIQDCKDSNIVEHNKLEQKMEKIDGVNLELQISVAKIETDIQGIKTGIIEIKEMIREKVS